MMCDYMIFIRGEMPEDGAAATSELFRTPDGNKVGNFSKELNRLQVAYGIILKRRKGDQRAPLQSLGIRQQGTLQGRYRAYEVG